ncbi:DUF4123 domain-containing protein [Burkholderia sp. FERM BP-3421]|jgi:hypothetical protein|uniref:DUF4123 domain-containing protein n=1 Tax=Burkholderia sp. FERM BP-3421 TaxID=1494466 RepID=UPI002361CEF7|nr:DUF4123 domain-containing protein [Burkholderia sp. FERM BP-3421]WDD95777.1 DUF4123 domain-containing protein [Burkholderia sp. FERM BP-3421]
MGLQAIFSEGCALDAHAYVLAVPLHNDSLPGALSGSPDHLVCLMDGGSEVQAVSPYLIYIPPARFESMRDWLERNGPASPCATVIVSPLSLAELAAHVKQFLRVRLPDDTPIVLAYWDPSILATLAGSLNDETLFVKGPVLSDDQRRAFFAPVLRWGYWDRHGVLRRLDWEQNEISTEAPALRPPFQLTQAQVDDLIEASVPDSLLLHLTELDPSMFADMPDRERYGLVCRQIERARQRGIEGGGALMEYCVLAARHGEAFDASQEGTALLKRLLPAASGQRRT